jgi:hypothetical protein
LSTEEKSVDGLSYQGQLGKKSMTNPDKDSNPEINRGAGG